MGLLVLATGCRQDPVTGRLATGSEAIGYCAEKDTIGLMDLEDKSGILDGGTFDIAPPGTRFRIIEDRDEVDALGNRKVRILILEGKHKDVAAVCFRRELRPVPSH